MLQVAGVQTLGQSIKDLLTSIGDVFSTMGFRDIIDILCVTLVIYVVVRSVQDTRAIQLLKGIGLFAIVYLVVNELGLKTMSWILNITASIGMFAIVVVFQPELRRGLEQMGRVKIPFFSGSFRNSSIEEQEYAESIEAIVAASGNLSKTKTGALIVIENEIRLGDIAKTGTYIDAKITPELLENLFFKNSPLHDGAVIVRRNRIFAAGCYLPLSTNLEIGRELGTRHRSALGMSENSDALIVVVSEETGDITLANDRRLYRRLSPIQLKNLLDEKLLPEKEEIGKKVKRGGKKEGKKDE